MDGRGLEFSVVSDLYEAGRGDDGQPVIGETFYVVGEAGDGSRVAHYARFAGMRRVTDEETGESGFVSVHAEAQANAERLCARIQGATAAGRALDPLHWTEGRPCYGSAAYIAGDWSARDAAEERAGEGR